ncbi:MAG: SRPBCC family protein [Solirubrobacterales bacterium]
MAPIVESIEIASPPEAVFAYLSHPENLARWQEGVVEARLVSDGPLGEGSLSEVTRHMGPRVRTLTVRYTRFDPPRGWALRGIDGPVRPLPQISIEPAEGGSRVTFELDFEGHGLGRLLRLLVRRQAKRELPVNLANAKRQLEGDPSG